MFLNIYIFRSFFFLQHFFFFKNFFFKVKFFPIFLVKIYYLFTIFIYCFQKNKHKINFSHCTFNFLLFLNINFLNFYLQKFFNTYDFDILLLKLNLISSFNSQLLIKKTLMLDSSYFSFNLIFYYLFNYTDFLFSKLVKVGYFYYFFF